MLPVDDLNNPYWNDYERRSRSAPVWCECRPGDALSCALDGLTNTQLKTPSVLAGVKPCRCNCHEGQG